MGSLRAHWGGLIAVAAAVVGGAFALPWLAPEPDLQENRSLAPAPSLRDPTDIAAFRHAADAYVADHFPPRTYLIAALNRLRLLVGASGSRRVVVGHRGWLFSDDGSHLGAGRGQPALSDAEVETWLAGLAGRTAALRAQGVTYLVLSPPVKEVIYPGLAPDWFTPDTNRAAVTLARLADASAAGKVIYPYAELADAAHYGLKVYAAHDTHWTGLGAYWGYVALMRELERRGVGTGPRPLEAFREERVHAVNKPRNLALMLGVSSFVDVDFPELGDPAAEERLKVTLLTARSDWTAPRVIDTGSAGKPVLLMTMDSFSSALLPFLYGDFSRIVLTHNQEGVWRPDLVARFHPDVVVTEILESGLPQAMQRSPAPAPEALAEIRSAVAVRQRYALAAWNPWADAKPRMLSGSERDDRLEGIEAPDDIQGRGGADTIHGRGADDVLRGGRGNDLIFGEDGDDWIEGGRGDDTLIGGLGADTFSAFEGSGLDLVLDFTAGQGDRVVLAPDLAFTVRQQGADTVIEFAGGRVVLKGVQAASLPKGAIRNRPASLAPGG
ncbi:MAG TPA: hypothetical protein VFH92_14130 [Phenylobacterium sp.]|nr:hypothetical protein [Phenylobacterium sp.]